MLLATVLALASAVLHAGWNLVAKRSVDAYIALWGQFLLAGVISGALLLVVEPPPAASWWFAAGSAACHVPYVVALGWAYRHGDFSLAYPIARGGGALLAAIGGVLVLGDQLSTAAIAAILVVVSGMVLLARGAASAQVAAALVVAASIGGYTLFDSHADRRAWRRAACSAALARTSSRSTRVGRPASRSTSPSHRRPLDAGARRERDVPRRVDVVVAPRHRVVARLGHERVALLEPRPRRVGRGEHVVGAVGDVGEAELLQHVGADAVGAEHDRVRSARRRGVADAVVHVRARVVGDGAGQVAVERHAVDEQPVVGGQPLEPSAGGVHPPGPRRHVDVHADAEVAGQPGGRLERVVAAGERGVHADHPTPAGAQEPLVLGQAAARAVGAVAVGDAVRAHHPHPDLGARVGDHVEAALDRVRALVVVDDGGGAAQQRLGGAEQGAGAQHVEVERGVEPPPDLLEDLAEGGRLRGGAGIPRASVEYRWWCRTRDPGWWRWRSGRR
jgi:multidrug transporter EmrE-like cation transporter